jgi:hypothetical protein
MRCTYDLTYVRDTTSHNTSSGRRVHHDTTSCVHTCTIRNLRISSGHKYKVARLKVANTYGISVLHLVMYHVAHRNAVLLIRILGKTLAVEATRLGPTPSMWLPYLGNRVTEDVSTIDLLLRRPIDGLELLIVCLNCGSSCGLGIWVGGTRLRNLGRRRVRVGLCGLRNFSH